MNIYESCRVSCSLIELESSGLRKDLRLHFLYKSRTRTKTFTYNLADDNWHTIAVSATAGSEYIKVLIDCTVVLETRLAGYILQSSPGSTHVKDRHLWIGQRNSNHGHFKVSSCCLLR